MKYKYNEDKILKELQEYIDTTYNAHYVGENNIQTVDVWDAVGIGPESFQSNVLKYAMRYGKKDGYNKKDLLKIIHYTILWWNATQGKEQHTGEAVADTAAELLLERAEAQPTFTDSGFTYKGK